MVSDDCGKSSLSKGDSKYTIVVGVCENKVACFIGKEIGVL